MPVFHNLLHRILLFKRLLTAFLSIDSQDSGWSTTGSEFTAENQSIGRFVQMSDYAKHE